MKAILWDGGKFPDCLSFGEIDRPENREDWVVVKNQVGGICGTDLHILFGKISHLFSKEHLPVALGHEFSGLVDEVGEGVTHVKEGDRVTLEIILGCYELGLEPCDSCKVRLYNTCENMTVVGTPTSDFIIPGCFSEYSNVHKNMVYPLPDNLTLDDGATMEPLAVAVRASNRSGHNIGDDAAVLGCGMVGLDMIQVLRAGGANEIHATAKYPFQAKIAKRFGADEVVVLEGRDTDPVTGLLALRGGKGFDRVFECVGGSTGAITQAVDLVRPGGKIVLLGYYSGEVPVNLLTLILKEANIIMSSCYTYGVGSIKTEFQAAIDLVAKGSVIRSPLVTHRFKMEDYEKAFDVATNKGREEAIKVVFDYR